MSEWWKDVRNGWEFCKHDDGQIFYYRRFGLMDVDIIKENEKLWTIQVLGLDGSVDRFYTTVHKGRLKAAKAVAEGIVLNALLEVIHKSGWSML